MSKYFFTDLGGPLMCYKEHHVASFSQKQDLFQFNSSSNAKDIQILSTGYKWNTIFGCLLPEGPTSFWFLSQTTSLPLKISNFSRLDNILVVQPLRTGVSRLALTSSMTNKINV